MCVCVCVCASSWGSEGLQLVRAESLEGSIAQCVCVYVEDGIEGEEAEGQSLDHLEMDVSGVFSPLLCLSVLLGLGRATSGTGRDHYKKFVACSACTKRK